MKSDIKLKGSVRDEDAAQIGYKIDDLLDSCKSLTKCPT